MNATIKRATFEITDEEAIDLFHALKRDLEYTIDTHWNRHLATLRRERDELRAELLTTHQMACRVGLERDELAKRQNAANDARPKAVASGSLFDGPANDSK